MTGAFALLALFLGLVIPVAVGVSLVLRGKRQLDAAVAYRQVASELGIDVDTRGVSVHGRVGEQRLWIGEVMVGHGTDRRTAIWGVLDHDRPLGLGMQVRRRGLSERVFRRGRAPGVELGDAFDAQVEILGDSPARVRALVGDPAVKGDLSNLMARWSDVVVTDSSVRVHLRRHETSEQRLMQLVDSMRTLSQTLSVARRSIPAPDQLAHVVEHWPVLAERLTLLSEPWLPALSGTHQGRDLLVAAARTDRGYTGYLRLTMGPHKELGLRVGEQVAPDGYWSVGQDIQFDDPDFDAGFVVKGWDPDKVREALMPEVREALLELASCGVLHLEDHQLTVRDIDTAVASIERTIGCATAVADALGW